MEKPYSPWRSYDSWLAGVSNFSKIFAAAFHAIPDRRKMAFFPHLLSKLQEGMDSGVMNFFHGCISYEVRE